MNIVKFHNCAERLGVDHSGYRSMTWSRAD